MLVVSERILESKLRFGGEGMSVAQLHLPDTAQILPLLRPVLRLQPGGSNRCEVVWELKTAERLKKVAGGKRSATTGLLRDVHANDPEGITAISWT